MIDLDTIQDPFPAGKWIDYNQDTELLPYGLKCEVEVYCCADKCTSYYFQTIFPSQDQIKPEHTQFLRRFKVK
jgi:hypothetical protein